MQVYSLKSHGWMFHSARKAAFMSVSLNFVLFWFGVFLIITILNSIFHPKASRLWEHLAKNTRDRYLQVPKLPKENNHTFSQSWERTTGNEFRTMLSAGYLSSLLLGTCFIHFRCRTGFPPAFPPFYFPLPAVYSLSAYVIRSQQLLNFIF